MSQYIDKHHADNNSEDIIDTNARNSWSRPNRVEFIKSKSSNGFGGNIAPGIKHGSIDAKHDDHSAQR